MVIKGGSSEVYDSFLNDVIKSVPSLSSADSSLSQEDMVQLMNSISQLDFVDNIYFNGAEDNLIFSDNKFIVPVSNETTEEHLKKLGNSDDEVKVIDTSVDTVIQSLREKSKFTISKDGVSQINRSTTMNLGVSNESETDVLLNLFKSVTPNGYFNEQQKMMLLEGEDSKQDYQLDTDEGEIIGGNSEESYINDDEEDESDSESTSTDDYSDDDEDEDDEVEEYEPDVTLSYKNIEVQTQTDYIDDDEDDSAEDDSSTASTELSDYVDDEDDEENNELIPDSSNSIQEMGYNNVSPTNSEKGVLNSVTVQGNLDNESSLYPTYFNSEDGGDNFVSASSTDEEYEDDYEDEYEDDEDDEDSEIKLDSNDVYYDDSDDEDSDEDSDSSVSSSPDSYFDDDDEDESENNGVTSDDEDDEETENNGDTAYVDDDEEDETEDTVEGSNPFPNTVSYSTDNYLDDDDEKDEDEVPKYNTTFDDSYSDDDDSDEDENTFSTQGNLGTNSFNNSEDIVDNFNQSSSSPDRKIISNVREETSDDKLANSIARLAEGVIKLPRTIKKGIRSARDYMRVDNDEVSENNII